jgi:hypothetical protein
MWFRVDDGFHSSRKLHHIPKRQRFAAIGLWTVAGSWAMHELTDGHVPHSMIAMWGPPPSAAESLVNAGLWDRTHDGFEFRNWAEYQASRDDMEAERAASRARKQASRNRLKQQKLREHAEHEGVSRVTGHDVTDPGDGGVTAPIPSHTIPSHKKDSSSTDEEFDRWYAIYPRKEAKTAARRAFAKARKSVDMDTLMTALGRYVDSVKGKDRQFIALPASWLNAGRWEDEYAPPAQQSLVPAGYAWFNR